MLMFAKQDITEYEKSVSRQFQRTFNKCPAQRYCRPQLAFFCLLCRYWWRYLSLRVMSIWN